MRIFVSLIFCGIFVCSLAQLPSIGSYSTPIPPPGSFYQGGVIGYIYNSSNATNCANIYNPCKYKGIILDTANYLMTWGPSGSVTGTQGCVGSGLNNTNTILTILGSSVSTAAKFCDSIIVNGYSDWFLPSNSEIHSSGINGITTINWLWNAPYWSSSFYNGANPFTQWGYSTVQPGGSGVYFMNRTSLNWVKPARYLEINLPYISNDSVVINSGENVNLSLQAYSQTGPTLFLWNAISDNPKVCGESLVSSTSNIINDILINTSETVESVFYSVQGQSQSNGCTGDPKIVKVIILPSAIPFSAGSDTTICEGSPVVLNGTGADSYVWNDNVVNGQSFNPIQTATYTLTGIIGQGCSIQDSILVTVLDNSNNIMNVSAVDSFMLNGETYTQSGTYTQNLISSNGCDSLITLNLSLNFTGIHNFETPSFMIFPNPCDNQLKINTSDYYLGKSFIIYDHIGRIIHQGTISSNVVSIPTHSFENGMYTIVLEKTKEHNFTVLHE